MGENKDNGVTPHGPIPSEDSTHYRSGYIGQNGKLVWLFTKPDCEKCPDCPGCPDQYEDYLS